MKLLRREVANSTSHGIGVDWFIDFLHFRQITINLSYLIVLYRC